MAGEFLDSNVLVYAFTDDPRAAAAQALLARRCAISVQGLNELANVARRKLGHSSVMRPDGTSRSRASRHPQRRRARARRRDRKVRPPADAEPAGHQKPRR